MNELISAFDKAILEDTAFPVDFDDAWQWVGYSTKQKAKDALERAFVEGEDYHINRKVKVVKRKQGGGTAADSINLSLDCFKAFCMMAGTEKGKEVRRYFIEAEKRLRQIVDDRRISKAVRRSLTDQIRDSALNDKMHGFAYKTITDLIYKVVLGMDARRFREAMSLPKDANVREHLTAIQLTAVERLEKLTGSMVELGAEYDRIKDAVLAFAAPVDYMVTGGNAPQYAQGGRV